jgi:hypothetical protein
LYILELWRMGLEKKEEGRVEEGGGNVQYCSGPRTKCRIFSLTLRRIEEEQGTKSEEKKGKDRTMTRQEGTKSLFAHCDNVLTPHVRR